MTTESTNPATPAAPAAPATGELPGAAGTTPTDLPAEGTTPPAESEGKPEGTKTEVKAPETYTFEMPEGVELDETSAGEFSVIAKELDLSQEQAQKVVGLYAKNVQAQMDAHKATVAGWVEALKTDADVGGDKLAGAVATARKAVEALGSTELKTLLDTTGLGNHPAVFKLMHRVGVALSEDRLVISGEGGATNTDIATALYPSQNKGT